jgi:hypothetical protein
MKNDIHELLKSRRLKSTPRKDRPRCGAKTRKGTPCQAQALANGRCKYHGGLSTGPRLKWSSDGEVIGILEQP